MAENTMKTTNRLSAKCQPTRLLLTATQLHILYQVMHHVQKLSHNSVGDVFWKVPSIDTLALEIGKFPHQIIDDVNALIRFGLVVKEKDEKWLTFYDSAQEDNVELRPDYIVRPTAKRLGELAEQVSRRSIITCVIPESGVCRFMSVAQLFRDLGKLKDERLRVTITRSVKDSPYEKTSELDIESAYIHNRLLYYVLDYEGRSI